MILRSYLTCTSLFVSLLIKFTLFLKFLKSPTNFNSLIIIQLNFGQSSNDYDKLFETGIEYDVIIYAGEEQNVKEIRTFKYFEH